MSEHTEWKRVADALRCQAEYLNEHVKEQPRTAFSSLKTRFDAAVATFLGSPTLEAANEIAEIGQWLVRKVPEELSPSKRHELAKEIVQNLEAVRSRVEAELPRKP